MRGTLPVPVVAMVFLTFVLGISEFIVMGILPDIAEGIGVAYTDVGGLVSVYALGYAVLTPMVAAVMGRFNRFRVMVVFTVLFILVDAWSMLATDYLSMLLSRVATAAVAGFLFSLGLAITVEVVSPEARAGSMAWMYAGFNMSTIAGLPLGTLVTESFGWRSAFLMILAMAVLALVLLWVSVPHGAGSVERPTGGSGGAADLVRDPRVILGAMVTVFAFGGSYCIFTYITPILEDMVGLDGSMVGAGLMLFGVMCLVSNLVAGRLSGMGGFRLAHITFGVQILVMLSMPLVAGIPVASMAFLMAVGLMMYLMNSSAQMAIMDVASRDYPGAMTLASSINPMAFNVGIVAGSYVAGAVFDGAGVEFLGFGGAVFIAMALVSALVLRRYCSAPGRGTCVT